MKKESLQKGLYIHVKLYSFVKSKNYFNIESFWVLNDV